VTRTIQVGDSVQALNVGDLPNLGTVTDGALLVGHRGGTGVFSASAMLRYVSAAIATSKAGVVSVIAFGATGDGVTNDAPFIQAAIDAVGAGTVVMPTGTYRITSAIKLRPFVTLQGYGNAILKQGNAANLDALVDFNSYAAVYADVSGLIIDGNRAANTETDLVALVSSAQQGASVTDCVLQNAPGRGVRITGGPGTRVENNTFNSTFSFAATLFGPSPDTLVNASVCNNVFYNIGAFCIGVVWMSQVRISGNRSVAVKAVQRVTTAGTVVAFLSGTNFTALRNGMFIRINQVEHQILTVNSATSLTLAVTAGNQTNVPSVAGTADQINVDSSSFVTITDNHIYGGMSGGIVIHNAQGATNGLCTVIAGNSITECGNMGIALATAGATSLDGTVISHNTVTNCGCGTANVAGSNDGIWIIGGTTNNTVIVGNYSRDLGGGSQEYGVYVDASVPASVMHAGNILAGSIAPSFGLGWHAYTPTVASVTGAIATSSAAGRYHRIDSTVFFEASVTITSNGTGGGAVAIGLPLTSLGGLGGSSVVSGRATTISGNMLCGDIGGNADVVNVQNYDNTYPGASGEVLVISGTYEAKL
jgi:hypothetical protein